MPSIYMIISIVALIILLIVLIIIGTTLANRKSSWPPMVPNCPDYWLDTHGDGSKCVNKKRLGTCQSGATPQTMNFTLDKFTGSDGSCNKYTWANACNLSWDGLTYGAKNPCDDDNNDA